MKCEIIITPSHKTDRAKWNECICKSPNGLIYATTDYLDHITDNWTGIVVNDYEMVMPVAWRKKYGIKYAYDVPFIQQLGIFSVRDDIPFEKIISSLFSICRYGDYNFNFSNNVTKANSHTNFVLPLSDSYENLAKGFSAGARHTIKRSESHGLNYVAGTIDEATDIYQQLYGRRLRHFKDIHYKNFKAVCRLLQVQDQVVVRKVTDGNDVIHAIVLLLKDNRRLYNIVNCTLPEGRPLDANYFLFSGIWKEFQQAGLLFDFEGSDVPGVNAFYKKFGAVNQPYFKFHFNHLPWPARLFKS